MPRSVAEYIVKLQNMKKNVASYFNGPVTNVQLDMFLDDLRSMKEAHDAGYLEGPAENSYEDLIQELKTPNNETAIHQEIKKRAINAFTNMAGDLTCDAAFDADYYSSLYELISNDEKLREERTEYEQKKWAEDQYNNEMRNAFKNHDRNALDEAKTARDAEGFTDVRNQFINEGYEQGKLFNSCNKISNYIVENKNKGNKTDEEKYRFERIERMSSSHLFLPFMKVANDINKDKEKTLYNENVMKAAMEQAIKAAEQKQQAEREKKVADFKNARDTHIDNIQNQFKQFNKIRDRLGELNTGKSTKMFDQMFQQMDIFNTLRWDQDNYKESCLSKDLPTHYSEYIKKMMEKVDDYIKYKQKQFFPGKLGKQRLQAARDMKALLTEMQNEMNHFNDYRSEHTDEADALKVQMNLETAQSAHKNNAAEENVAKQAENKDALNDALDQTQNHADERHVDERHVDEKHADEKHADEKHADEKHADEKHADEKNVGKQTEQNVAEKDQNIPQENQKQQPDGPTREELLAPYSAILKPLHGEFREIVERDLLNAIYKKMNAQKAAPQQKPKEKISFDQLRKEMTHEKEVSGKVKRSKEADELRATVKRPTLDAPLKK